MLEMPGVIASYHLDAAEANYVRYGTNHMTGDERAGSCSTATSSWTPWPRRSGRTS